MYLHSDPTANRAIGFAEREWKAMAQMAYNYRTNPRMAEKIPEPELVFTGIFSRLLTDPLNQLKLIFQTGRSKRENGNPSAER